MTRISLEHDRGFTCFGVEGSLAELLAKELKECWQEVCASRERPECLLVDLIHLVNIDSFGKEILIEMYRSGVGLFGSSVITRAVIEEITRRQW